MAATPLIRGGWILTLDARGTELPAGDLLIADDRIADVGTRLAAPADAEVIDAAGMLVLPGLIDTHRHTWQTPLRHLGGQWALKDYSRLLLGEVGARYQPADVYAGTLLGALGALGALDAGITTLVDWAHIQNSPAHADASVAALRDAGIRAVFAHGWSLQRGWTDSPAPHPPTSAGSGTNCSPTTAPSSPWRWGRRPGTWPASRPPPATTRWHGSSASPSPRTWRAGARRPAPGASPSWTGPGCSGRT
jgi:cytosine/adenosine deaminase-related metal-dependent hydrolase